MPDPSPLGVVTPLRAAGYTVLPTPQQVELRGADVRLNEEWRIERIDIAGDDIAAAALIQGVRDTAGIELAADGGSHPIQLSVRAGALNPPDEQLDAARAAQAYILDIAPEAIHITGNTPQGLFFGVQTFLQLLKQDGAGRWILPHGVIRDWPAYELRICHWDTKHHQDRIETLKRYLDWCARFKVNMISLELEDKFAYPSHPQIGQPAALMMSHMERSLAN